VFVDPLPQDIQYLAGCRRREETLPNKRGQQSAKQKRPAILVIYKDPTCPVGSNAFGYHHNNFPSASSLLQQPVQTLLSLEQRKLKGSRNHVVMNREFISLYKYINPYIYIYYDIITNILRNN